MTGQTLVEELQNHLDTCRTGTGVVDVLDIDGNTLHGRAVPYDVPIELAPNVREVFKPGAFKRADTSRVKFCLEHGRVAGKVTRLHEKDDGLYFDATIPDDSDLPVSREAAAMIRNDLADELSVGFSTIRNGSETVLDGDTSTWVHHRARLFEISLVPWGAYGRNATLSRARIIDPIEEQRRALRAWVATLR